MNKGIVVEVLVGLEGTATGTISVPASATPTNFTVVVGGGGGGGGSGFTAGGAGGAGGAGCAAGGAGGGGGAPRLAVVAAAPPAFTSKARPPTRSWRSAVVVVAAHTETRVRTRAVAQAVVACPGHRHVGRASARQARWGMARPVADSATTAKRSTMPVAAYPAPGS